MGGHRLYVLAVATLGSALVPALFLAAIVGSLKPMLLAYPAALLLAVVLGLPAYFVLHARGLANYPTGAVAGAVIAAVFGLVVGVRTVETFLWLGAMGAAAGLVFLLLVRQLGRGSPDTT